MDDQPDQLHRLFPDLMSGQRQLDEATNHLDHGHEIRVLEDAPLREQVDKVFEHKDVVGSK